MTIKKCTFFARNVAFLACILFFFSSCSTYFISKEELYTQIHAAKPQQVRTGISGSARSQVYMANGVQEIHCTNNKRKKVIIYNSPKVEMRIIDNRNKKHFFYFDTITLQDSVFTGLNSRILPTKKSVKYSDIKRVELQKGAKAYYYNKVIFQP